MSMQNNLMQGNSKVNENASRLYMNWKQWVPDEFGSLNSSERKYFKSEIERTGRQFPIGSRVLEIGFGNGAFLAFSRENRWDIHGTEVNEILLEEGRSRGYECFHAANLNECHENFYDLIVAFDVMEHLEQDDILPFLGSIKKILKSGGFFISRFPNGDSPFGLVNQNGDVTHLTTLGYGKIKYFESQIKVDQFFFGAQSVVILGKNPISTIKRLCVCIFKFCVEFFVNFLSEPRRCGYCSANLVWIFRKQEV